MEKELQTSEELEIFGSRVRFWQYNPGNKPTILVLHGFTGNHMGLLPVVNLLSDFHIIAPDFPGFGFSTPMTQQGHDIEGLSEFVIEFIKKTTKKPILLGHSLGSVVAARLASLEPQLIGEKIILVSPAAQSPLKTASVRNLASRIGESHYWLGLKTPYLGKKLLYSRTISKTATNLLVKTKDRQLRKFITKHHLGDLEFLKNPEIFLTTYRSLNRQGVADYAPKINKHCLLIAGHLDTIWPHHTQKQLVDIMPDARLELLKGVGHLTHFENPQAIARAIKTFLS